jgi:hypothetical protein
VSYSVPRIILTSFLHYFSSRPYLRVPAPAAEGPPWFFGFKEYGRGPGVTNPSITAITQDLDGFLWVGTEDGLFRLEGEKFHRFGTEDGCPPKHIEALSFARPKGIWVVTLKGIAWWDGRHFRRPRRLRIPRV